MILAALAVLLFLACGNSTETSKPDVVQTQPSTPTAEEVQAKKQQQIDIQEATKEELKKLGIEDPIEASASEVNYTSLAESYCQCSSNSKQLDSEMKSFAESGQSAKFQEMAPKVEAEFKKAIACAKVKKEKATDKALNKSLLVKEMKGICPSLPAKLVMDLITKV